MATIQNKNAAAETSVPLKSTATTDKSQKGDDKDKQTLLAVLQFLKNKNLTVRLVYMMA